MKRLFTICALTAFVAVLTGTAAAGPDFEGFETGTGTWSFYDGGAVSGRVPSGGGVLGVNSASGSYHAELGNVHDIYGYLGLGMAGHSYFGGTDFVYQGTFYGAVDVYIDPTWSGSGFWIDMSPTDAVDLSGLYAAEANFRLTADGSSVAVQAINSSTLTTITTAGWYSFEIVWSKGATATDLINITLNVYDSASTLLGSETLLATFPPGTHLGESQYLGNNSYVWFTVWQNTFANDVIAIDNVRTGLILPPACITPPTDLVSWWPGEDNANDIQGTNDGTLVGNATFVSPGKVGDAFTFSGSGADYVRVPNDPSLEPTTVTVDAWVRANSPGNNGYIVAKGAKGCIAASYALYTSGGGLGFYVFNGSIFKLSPNAGAGIWDGNWHHVAGTYDGAFVRLYVDGAEVGSGTSTNISIGYSLSSDNDLIIGQYPGTCSLPFRDDIDEVEIYNRALSASEIQAIFNAGSAGKCKVAPLELVVETEKAKVCWHHDDLHVEGKLSLPEGVWMDTLSPAGSAVITLAGVDVINPAQIVEFAITGKNDDKWEYKDKENFDGPIKEFKIDWKGGKFDYKGDDGFHIHTHFIGASETTLCIHTGDVSEAFMVTIDETDISYDADRNITTIPEDLPYEPQKGGNTHVHFTLPFQLTSEMTIEVTGTVDLTINVAVKEGVAKFKLVSAFDSGLFPDGSESSLDDDDLKIEISLGDDDPPVSGSDLIEAWTKQDDKHWEYK